MCQVDMNVYNFKNKIKRLALISLVVLISVLFLHIILKNACNKYASNLRESLRSHSKYIHLADFSDFGSEAMLIQCASTSDMSLLSKNSTGDGVVDFSNIDTSYDKSSLIKKGLIGRLIGSFRPLVDSLLIWNDKVLFLLDDARIVVTGYLAQVLSFDVLSFLTQLTLGYTSVSNTTQEHLFEDIGILHLLVISGSHFSLITQRFDLILAKIFNKYFRTILLYLFLIFYCFFVGWSSSVVRAFIFLSLKMSTLKLFQRKNDELYLFFLGFCIHFILLNYQISDLGFQLSYLASFAIIISGKIKFTKVNVLVMIFIAPALVLYFGEVNLGTVIFTYLLSSLINYLLELGLYTYVALFVLGSLSFIKELLVFPFMIVSKFLFLIMEFFSLIEYTYPIDNIKTYHIVFYYVLLFVFLSFFYLYNNKKNIEANYVF